MAAAASRNFCRTGSSGTRTDKEIYQIQVYSLTARLKPEFRVKFILRLVTGNPGPKRADADRAVFASTEKAPAPHSPNITPGT